MCVFAKKCIFMVLAEKYVLWVWRKNTFFAGWTEKVCFEVLAGKYFDGKTHFSGFGGKIHFFDFGEKMRFFGFGGKICFPVLAGKCVFRFWRENVFSGFGGKISFFFRF